MRILIAGAGAIGQLLGARLAAADHDVTLLLRAAHRDAIQADGLRVHGHTTFHAPVPCITDPAEAAGDRPFDAAVITAKAYATYPLALAVAPLLGSDGVLASLQNGLGNGQKLCRVVPADRAAVALTSHGVTVEGLGRIHHAGTGTTQVGPAPGSSRPDAARRMEALLTDAGLDPVWHDEMRAPIWRKAVVNAAINPVGALYGVRNGEIREREDLHSLAQSLAAEAAALAVRARVELDLLDPAGLVDTVLGATAANKCSMLQDMEARRPTEIEQITGRMVRLGETLLVPMPRSDQVYGRVKDRERSYLPEGEAERTAWEELEHIRDPF